MREGTSRSFQLVCLQGLKIKISSFAKLQGEPKIDDYLYISTLYLFICLSIYSILYLSIYLSICLSIYLSIISFTCLSICLSICLPILSFTCLSSDYMFVYLFYPLLVSQYVRMLFVMSKLLFSQSHLFHSEVFSQLDIQLIFNISIFQIQIPTNC